ncbi:hypothetical protein WJ45_18025 [Burkholderia ubonensis]|nr:hypothetical protein WJ45_18025 [Burkholderia ubonensis]KVQ45501.1 hypothetical protein WK04_11970 [Burkholderia ubonensis]
MWGFTSERGRRLIEGRELTAEEAELIVGLAAAISVYLAKLGGWQDTWATRRIRSDALGGREGPVK